jgi:predicted XRE-type DNA-binding protein
MGVSKNPLELIAKDPVHLSLVTLKSKLMMIITKLIREHGWTQGEAAKELSVSQPRISNIFNAKIDRFSIDMLIEMLGKLGYLMNVSFDPSNKESPIEIGIKKTTV